MPESRGSLLHQQALTAMGFYFVGRRSVKSPGGPAPG